VQIDDPWLTQRFAEARSIRDLNNVRIFLTEDLRYLVVSPMAIWNHFQDGRDEIFEFDGRTHTRADVGLAYSRPAAKPQLFRQNLDDQAGFNAEPPHGAFSIDGELYLFMSDKTMLRLYTPDGRKETIVRATPDLKWHDAPYPTIQHAPDAHELVLFETNEITLQEHQNEIVIVIRWNYAKNVVTRTEVPIRDLFMRKGGKLRPKSAQAVR
jgi:hypothetical protein